MLENLRNSIDLLKRRVQFNLDMIHQNEKIIRELLKEPVTDQRSEKLAKRFDFNKNLLQENTDAILLQKNMITFVEKYHNEISEFTAIIEINELKNKSLKEISKDDYFDLTINQELDFNEQHPYYQDEEFLNDLLDHFSNVENYEMCSKLIKQTNNKNLSEK